jgi:hypothetical protein
LKYAVLYVFQTSEPIASDFLGAPVSIGARALQPFGSPLALVEVRLGSCLTDFAAGNLCRWFLQGKILHSGARPFRDPGAGVSYFCSTYKSMQ